MDEQAWSIDVILVADENQNNWSTPAYVPFYPQHIPHGLPWDRTQTSVVSS